MARPRKSAQELQLSGTFSRVSSRKNWNTRNDRELTKKPAPSRYLQRTKEAWNQFMDVKATQKVLSAEDERSVVLMFDALDRYFRMSDEIDKIYRKPDFAEWLGDISNQKQFKLMKTELRADNDVFKNWAIRFGMTPTERSKLSVPKVETEDEIFSILKEG